MCQHTFGNANVQASVIHPSDDWSEGNGTILEGNYLNWSNDINNWYLMRESKDVNGQDMHFYGTGTGSCTGGCVSNWFRVAQFVWENLVNYPIFNE